MWTYQPLAGLQQSETTGTLNGNVVIAAGTAIIGKAPAAGHGGGVLISEAFIQLKSGTVASCGLYDMGAAGTAIAGTICTLPTIYTGAPQAGTPGEYFLAAGRYAAWIVGAGTVACGVNNIGVTYLPGRAGV